MNIHILITKHHSNRFHLFPRLETCVGTAWVLTMLSLHFLGLDNLPAEVNYLLAEMKHKDTRSQGT